MRSFEEATDDIVKETREFFHQLREKHDFRLVAAAGLNEVSFTLQCGLSVNQISVKQIAEYYAASLQNAVQPLEKQASLIINDGTDSGRMQ